MNFPCTFVNLAIYKGEVIPPPELEVTYFFRMKTQIILSEYKYGNKWEQQANFKYKRFWGGALT